MSCAKGIGELWPTFDSVVALLPNIIIWLITLKLLHLEYFVPYVVQLLSPQLQHDQ